MGTEQSKDYAKVFECMVVVNEISREADKVVMKIREAGENAAREQGLVPFVAVHMRIEIDWMIHYTVICPSNNLYI